MSETLQDVANKLLNSGSKISSFDVAKITLNNNGSGAADPNGAIQTGTAEIQASSKSFPIPIYGRKTGSSPQFVQFTNGGTETFGSVTVPAVDFKTIGYNGQTIDNGTYAVFSFGTDAAGHSYAVLAQPTSNPFATTYYFVTDAAVLANNKGGTSGDSPQLTTTSNPGQVVFTHGFPAAPCFAEGTSLSTPSGMVSVESLRVGDMVSAVEDGSVVSRSVVWVGKRTIGLSQHPAPATVRPVCIRRDAFGAGVPARDLVVSPDHAIAVDGALIPARLLVNGATVVIDAARASVTYYHVELERHSVVLAEGLATESYLDTGNRSMFENGPAVSLRPDFSVSARVASGEVATCLPLLVDEASVRPVWTMLAERAAGRGHAVPGIATTREAELRVLADGAALPVSFDGAVLRCVVPAGAGAIMVASRSARPADVKPWLDDRRKLGVAVASVSVDGAEVSLDDAVLSGGWWGVETDGAASWRWTDGAARLALGVSDTARVLTITVNATGEYAAAEAEAARVAA